MTYSELAGFIESITSSSSSVTFKQDSFTIELTSVVIMVALAVLDWASEASYFNAVYSFDSFVVPSFEESVVNSCFSIKTFVKS